MRKFLPMAGILVVLALLAGCEESPTNGGGPTPTPVTFGITGVAVAGRTVTFTITGSTTLNVAEAGVRCWRNDGWLHWTTGSVEFPPGTYAVTVPVRTDGGHNVDALCGGTCGEVFAQRVGGDTKTHAVCWTAAPSN